MMVREGARDASETTGETTEEIGVMRGASIAVMTDVTRGASIAVTTDVTTGASIAVTTAVTIDALIAVTTDATATEMKEVMKGTPTGVTEATAKDELLRQFDEITQELLWMGMSALELKDRIGGA